ncbi:alpha/beta hydrolase family protein [Legionella waltersii]|uniref:Secreted protein n=1 Tax=Legionella waltersii TaxID=66969 RepID=A0A0W1AMG0_9GAMM|nr:hypothetical protein [Legionella waltersii]KTD82519.1 secreted protein [Legionella waltersii]SNV03018.1 secreted protein [Legionella waltersii]
MQSVKRVFYTFFLFIVSFSVNAYSPTQQLVSYVSLGNFSQHTAELALKKMPPLDTLHVHHDLQLYKINYQTPAPDGSISIASGLVAMPISPTKPVSIVSYHHGTRFEKKDVPSRNNEKNHMYLAALGSSAGFMIVMPDYLGLGDNDLPIHPYVQADTLASSSVNMLLAAKELASALRYPVNDKLYLTGYSEGGFTTMVMFELLANDFPDIPITAVAAGSAPFDWKETMNFVMLEPGPRATAYLAYFFYSLQTYRHYWANFDEIFTPPFNTQIPSLLDGLHSTSDILKALPQDPKFIFQSSFFDGIINEKDKNTDSLKMNFNHYGFIPTAPLLLVGTKGDKDVPYAGAEMAYEVFKQHSDFVWIKSVSNTLDHVQAHPFVLKEQLEFFQQYENQQWTR